VIVPLALIGLISLPLILAFYMLRLRRRDVPVGSIFLWQQLVRAVEANAPWPRLRFSWLLLLQLLIAALVVFAAARPFLSTTSQLGANTVLIVDTSASMGAIDGGVPRIQAARQAAREVVAQLPDGGRVTVVAADDSAHVLQPSTDDRAAALEAIGRIEATEQPGNLTDAFALASALAARNADSSVVVVSDANADRLPPVGIGTRVIVRRVGSTDANQAIAALSASRRAGGAQLDLFVAVSNPSAAQVTRRLEIYADDALVDARDLQIAAGQRAEAIVSTVPAAARVVEARLAGSDALAVDDRAFALIPEQSAVRALLVTAGNTYLENALALLPRLELYAVGNDGYADAIKQAADAGTPYGLIVFDRFVPPQAPQVPALYVGASDDGAFGTVDGVLEAPALARTVPDDPLLRFVDLSTLHVGRAADIGLAEGLRPVLAATTGKPLVAAGTGHGHRLALLSFALSDSDLPLQVAFPLLTSNLVDFLLPPTDGVLPPSVPLGQPISVSLDPSIETATITDGDSSTRLGLTAGRGTLPGARHVGLRELRLADGSVLGRTAANLFDPDESDVAPGDPQRISDMGRAPAAGNEQGQPSRAEWWWPLALAALLLLLVEWIVFHRPTRRAVQRLVMRPHAGSPRQKAASGSR
jgi:hypothetical protein